MSNLENKGPDAAGIETAQQGLMMFMYDGIDAVAPAAAVVTQTLKNATQGVDAVHGIGIVFRTPATMPKARVDEIARRLYDTLIDMVETTNPNPHVDPSRN